MKNKFIKSISLFLAAILLAACTLTGCSGKDYSKEILGTWYCWHWYYNIEDGDSGFYEEDNYLTFNIEEGKFEITKTDETVNKKGTYEWVKNGIADVYFDDGTTCKVEVSYNDRGQIKLMITETDLIYILEVE